jgi:asparagine synthase (glutamine-hydrolysing)
MSRITGIVSRASAGYRQALLDDMLSASRARSSWVSQGDVIGDAALGWCGWQTPNVALVGGVLAVLDGHIYNRPELGDASSAAALLALLYLQHGFSAALNKLNGDFAVALYDSRTATLWLARDRFGVKPLYYVAKPEYFAFASRPRALLTLPGVTRGVNRQFVALFAASHYRYFDNVPATSPYADIAQLPAAHLLRLTANHVTTTPYWSLQQSPDFTEPEAELAERYRELLLDAVARRVTSAQRPAFTLSGGMDSSSVLACSVRTTGARQHAFSTVYDDATYDESNEIRSMLATTVEQWHPVRVGSPDVVSLVAELVAVHDEPVATATWLSHYLLCQHIKAQGFTSLFGGLGGDELNAGEYEYFFFFFADLMAQGRMADLDRETDQWIAYHDHPIFRKSVAVRRDGLARLVDLQMPGKCLPDQQRLRRYYAVLNADYCNLADFEPRMDHPFQSYLKNRTFQDLFRETLPCCLRAEDRQTTALGLHHCLPFLDHRLVELMFRIPGPLKIRNGITKHLLRQAMRGILPEETRTRVKKTGWNAPAHVWFSGQAREGLFDLVHSRIFRERGIYHIQEVERLIAEHEQIVSSGRPVENHMMFLWQLVNLELWLQSIEPLDTGLATSSRPGS